MSKVDLHVHSTASDGRFSPTEVVYKSLKQGLNCIALTDHDTVDGITEALVAAAPSSGLQVVPGVEISTDVPHGEIHILGYYIDYRNIGLLNRLQNMRNSRVERARKMVEKLARLGVEIQWSRVLELAAGSSVGRPHIAQAMLEKNYINTFKEAFDRYIGREGPAYVERDKLTPVEAVKLISEVGGLPVFAHPLTFINYESIITELVAAGLVGVEAYYKNCTPEEIKKVIVLANKYNLIPTGGSDFHGIEANEVNIGGVEVPMESFERLQSLNLQRSLNKS